MNQPDAKNDILRRIEQDTGVSNLAVILADQLEPANLHSLLLEVYRIRSERRSPAAVLADYESSRFVRPAVAGPRLLLEWDRIAFSSLPTGFVPLELSPVCPFGTCSTVATVSQDKSLVTVRNLEVLSDLTNVLALECASRRRVLLKTNPKSSEFVRLAASHRMVRPQFSPDPRMLPHFRLFGACSAGRDTGDRRFEIQSLDEHLGIYIRALITFLGGSASLRVSITDLIFDPSLDWLAEVMSRLGEQFPGVDFRFDSKRTTGRGYYRDLCFKIHEISGEQPIELADGGSVDWTQKLLSNAKERLFISGVGSERVCGLRIEER